MIFVTVGTQLPFERLIKAIDNWAKEHPEEEVFAQIGETQYQPKAMTFVENMSPTEYAEKFEAAKAVVSHVGMGTIISGLENNKSLVLMPRIAALGEHRNDHQLATADKFKKFSIVDIVTDEAELTTALDARLASDGQSSQSEAFGVSPELLDALRNFVRQ